MSLSDRIKKLIGILDEEDLDEIEVRTWFTSVRIARRRDSASVSRPKPLPGETGMIEEPGIASVEDEEMPVTEDLQKEEDLEEFLSPMVGTFYRSAGPGIDPFISVGSHVETGQVLCIIEAMKLMNEIEAESNGIIRKILVEDSQPVEFGQPLFLVESA
jgi:acetyl-CoA carboxylase biotin carboxyl carrier protein